MTSLSCDRVQDLLPDRIAGRLEADTRAAVDAHLEACVACRAERDVVALVHASPPPVPELLAHRIVGAVRARPRARRFGTSRQLAAAATLAAAVIGGSLFLDGGPRPRTTADTPPATSPADLPGLPGVEDPVPHGGSFLAELTEAELEALLQRMES